MVAVVATAAVVVAATIIAVAVPIELTTAVVKVIGFAESGRKTLCKYQKFGLEEFILINPLTSSTLDLFQRCFLIQIPRITAPIIWLAI